MSAISAAITELESDFDNLYAVAERLKTKANNLASLARTRATSKETQFEGASPRSGHLCAAEIDGARHGITLTCTPGTESYSASHSQSSLPLTLQQRWTNMVKQQTEVSQDPTTGKTSTMWVSASMRGRTDPNIQKGPPLHGFLEELHAKTQKVVQTTVVRKPISQIQPVMPVRKTKRLSQVLFEAAHSRFGQANPALHMQLSRPHSRFRVFWSFIALGIGVLDAILIPPGIAWEAISHTLFMKSMTVAVLAYWALDAGIQFNSAFYEGGTLILDRSRRCWHYLKTWFVFDISLIFTDVVGLLLPDSPSLIFRVLRFVRMLRLLRVIKLTQIIQTIEDIAGKSGAQTMALFLAVVKAFCFVLYVVHTLGCFFYSVGAMSDELGFADNWMKHYMFEGDQLLEQYLVCVHWVLGQFTPAPVHVHPTNTLERGYTVMVILFGLLVMGTCISRISQSIQQVIRMNDEANSKRQNIKQYLHDNKVNLELSMRVMRFAEQYLTRATTVQLEKSVLSHALIKELLVDRNGPLIKKHPLFCYMSEEFEDSFTLTCNSLSSTMLEVGQVIFNGGSMAQGMCFLKVGEFGFEPEVNLTTQCDASEDGIQYCSELSLFCAYAHTGTLRSKSYSDVHMLTGPKLGECISHSPRCCKLVFQYARNLVRNVYASDEPVNLDLVSLSLCSSSLESTDIVRQEQLEEARWIENFRIVNDDGEHVGPSDANEIAAIWDKARRKEIDSEELIQAFESLFPELARTWGTFEAYGASKERNQALASMVSFVWLTLDNYEQFTQSQEDETRLSLAKWDSIQSFIDWVGIRNNPTNCHAMLVFLAIKPLGKVAYIGQQLPTKDQDPCQVILRIMHLYSHVVPSTQVTPDRADDLIRKLLATHQEFLFGQFMQAESSPLTVAQLHTFLAKLQDPDALRLFLLSGLCLTCGNGAAHGGKDCWGSKFLDDNNAWATLLVIESLQKLEERRCQEIYWEYLSRRAERLYVSTSTESDLAFVRLTCLCRAASAKAAEPLFSAWTNLVPIHRDVLTDFLLADGVNEPSITFKFLPDCFANSIENEAVGLGALLDILVDLVEMVHEKAVWSDELVVNLADMAAFIVAVKVPDAFFNCLDDAVMEAKHDHLFLNMTSKNWTQVASMEHVASVSSSLRHLRRYQKKLKTALADQNQRTSFTSVHAEENLLVSTTL
eukprot:TRINITY_DN6900_c0_g2_i1.p1 TRINITY_DN6900_c0_g2~~TRINITY_DN6900_c0_g2_i1.p1  ORF type:complete len:1183 (-),score=170.19 TRINITY_DN6900_c0_g2_i1:356-3904(-)